MSGNWDKDELFKAILEAQTVASLDKAPGKDLGPMDALNEYLQGRRLLSDVWEVVSLAQERIERLKDLIDLGHGEDVAQNHREKVGNWFGFLATILAKGFDLSAAAVGILVELWNQLALFQTHVYENSGELRRVYRAGVGMYIGRLYMYQREPGAALWWLLHAHADDLLGGQDRGAAKDELRLSFGVSDDVFQFMSECAQRNLAANRPHTYFAEHIVMQLSLRTDFSNLFSYATTLKEFQIGRAYASCMLARCEDSTEGTPLEEFARYLMLLLTGWVPTKNLYHSRTRMDSDLVARYTREPESISSSRARAILVECKNTYETISVSIVGYFLYRMHLTQVEVGILFTKGNISGHKTRSTSVMYAEQLLDLAFQRDGKMVIVIDIDDLRELISNKKTIWMLIDSRITERRFGMQNMSAEQ